MKILLVNDYAMPAGGVEIQMRMLRDGLRRRGHDARFFASSAGPGAGAGADYSGFGTTSPFRTLLQTANPWAARQLGRVLADFRPDVVHVAMFLTQLSPMILPLLAQVPSLYHVHWYRPICPRGTRMLPDGAACRTSPGAACLASHCLPLRDWLPLMRQMALWRRRRGVFDRIVAVSHAVQRRLLAEGIEPVEVIWNGVPAAARRAPLSGPPTVAFAGRLVPEKGADVLIRAWAGVAAQFGEARLLVAGDGPQRPGLEKLVADRGLSSHVTLLGHLPRAEVERRFAAAWVQAVPSRWDEPFGIVAAEAMMRGTAVVASDAGGLAEIVRHDRTGLLVPPGDADALAEALIRLLRDRETAENMGRAGREVARSHFSETTYVENFVRTYETLLSER